MRMFDIMTRLNGNVVDEFVASTGSFSELVDVIADSMVSLLPVLLYDFDSSGLDIDTIKTAIIESIFNNVIRCIRFSKTDIEIVVIPDHDDGEYNVVLTITNNAKSRLIHVSARLIR